jgi:hypothetical protein
MGEYVMTVPDEALEICGPEPAYYDDRGIVTLQHINWRGCISEYKIDHLNDPPAPIQDWTPTFPAEIPPTSNVDNMSNLAAWPFVVLIFFIVIVTAAMFILLVNQNKINRSDQEELNTDA